VGWVAGRWQVGGGGGLGGGGAPDAKRAKQAEEKEDDLVLLRWPPCRRQWRQRRQRRQRRQQQRQQRQRQQRQRSLRQTAGATNGRVPEQQIFMRQYIRTRMPMYLNYPKILIGVGLHLQL